MDSIKVNFKFKIGDVVQMKNRNLKAHRRWFPGREMSKEIIGIAKPQPITIVGRQYEECYGGSQNHYSVRGLVIKDDDVLFSYDSRTASGLHMLSEIELEHYED